MKINEVVTLHPAAKAKSEYDMLLLAGDEKQDEIIAYIMDDRNAQARRIEMLRHLDTLVGDLAYHYGPEELEDFMHDQGPDEWRNKLRKGIEDMAANMDEYSWSKTNRSSDEIDWASLGSISDTEMLQLAKDLKIPPYHLSVVDETEDDDTPTGEYEICQRCGGEGCIECEEGLKDITGVHKALDLDNFKGE